MRLEEAGKIMERLSREEFVCKLDKFYSYIYLEDRLYCIKEEPINALTFIYADSPADAFEIYKKRFEMAGCVIKENKI